MPLIATDVSVLGATGGTLRGTLRSPLLGGVFTSRLRPRRLILQVLLDVGLGETAGTAESKRCGGYGSNDLIDSHGGLLFHGP